MCSTQQRDAGKGGRSVLSRSSHSQSHDPITGFHAMALWTTADITKSRMVISLTVGPIINFLS